MKEPRDSTRYLQMRCSPAPEFLVTDGEGHVLADLTLQAFLDAGGAGAAAIVRVREMENEVLQL